MKRTYSLILSFLLAWCILATPALAAQENDLDSSAQNSSLPDAEGTVSWENLKSRIHTGDLSTQALAEQIESLNAINYEKMLDNLRQQLNGLAALQWYTRDSGGTGMYESASYDSLRDAFDAVKNGETQQDDAATIQQLEDAANQVLLAGERLYISILALEQSAENIRLSLQSLDRTIEEANLRYEMGLVSAFSVKELESSRALAASQLQTQESTIFTYKTQLQILLGETPTGNLTLGPLPNVSSQAMEAINYEADLDAAKEISWSLRSAEITLEKAQEAYKKDKKDYNAAYLYEVGEHTLNAAQITYQSSVQEFENTFTALYHSVYDYAQILESKMTATAYQQSLLSSVQLQYDIGAISLSALYEAQEQLAQAQVDELIAAYNLFDSYNLYCWAVEYGILNN